MMQSLKCCKLIGSLSCTVSRKQTLMHSCRGLVTASQMDIVMGLCRYHSRHLRLRADVVGFSGKQLGNSLQHRRLESSHTSGANSSAGRSNLISSEMNKSDGKDTADKHQALREQLRQMRDLGRHVPESISDADLEYYASLTSEKGRRKCLSFLFKKEVIRKKEKLQKIQRKLERSYSKETREVLPRNRITQMITGPEMLNWYNWRLASAMQWGPQLVFDFSFDSKMVRPDVVKMLSQLNHVMNANKVAKDPFHIHWTGLKEGNITLRELQRVFSGHLQNLMVNITASDVIEMFPREKLIYLTSDSPNVLHTFDVDKVYIVGGLVDWTNMQTGVTLAKAKRYNIEHARLPLDSYLKWGSGAMKALTLDQVVKILLTLHDTGDWVKALEHVPNRKHLGYKDEWKPELDDDDDDFTWDTASPPPRNRNSKQTSGAAKKRSGWFEE